MLKPISRLSIPQTIEPRLRMEFHRTNPLISTGTQEGINCKSFGHSLSHSLFLLHLNHLMIMLLH